MFRFRDHIDSAKAHAVSADSPFRMRALWPVLCMVACGPLDPPPTTFDAWDAVEIPECAPIVGLGDLALSTAGSRADEAGLLDDAFQPESLAALRAAPEAARCFEAGAAEVFDAIGASAHPVASAIVRAAALAGEPVEVLPFEAVAIEPALAAVCERTDCGEAKGALPDDLAAAMAPVLWAIADGLEARGERDASQDDGGRGAEWWRRYPGNGLIFDPDAEGYDPARAVDRAYLVGGRARLYGAAARIAYAVESVDWSPFVGRMSIRFDLETAAGVIRVRDGAPDRYQESEPTLLLVDLGGDDVHRDEVASNLSGANAVSVTIDLAGDDDYGFDGDARRFEGDERFGPISLSNAFRQGAARNGVAMLFDEAGDDVYRSLRGSQGYAQQGVGVLFDREGDDLYEAEAVSQGAAQFGIGLMIDLAGSDRYRSVYASQGFGFAGGVGLAFDASGADAWTCDDGATGELYRSAQLPGHANTSLCQGAGYGLRSDDPIVAMSGGLGVLRDREGDDSYRAGVFAQGTGYWQGVGLLSDGGGDDRYDALYYAQGSAVHYAAGVLIDHGGDDVRGASLVSQGYSLGAGYDYGLGVLFDLDGRDEARFTGMSVGAASTVGVGLYYDRAGDD